MKKSFFVYKILVAILMEWGILKKRKHLSVVLDEEMEKKKECFN